MFPKNFEILPDASFPGAEQVPPGGGVMASRNVVFPGLTTLTAVGIGSLEALPAFLEPLFDRD